MNSELLRNKNLYKVFIYIVKYLPMLLSLIQIALLIFNYFGIVIPIVTYIGGTSLLFLGLLYIISYAFKFCYLYRIPIYYNFIIGLMSIIRVLGFLPIELIDLYRVYAIISGFFISLFVYGMYKNRNNPKIDHIKEFCKRYGCCS